jgi:hypothetical protein
MWRCSNTVLVTRLKCNIYICIEIPGTKYYKK